MCACIILTFVFHGAFDDALNTHASLMVINLLIGLGFVTGVCAFLFFIITLITWLED